METAKEVKKQQTERQEENYEAGVSWNPREEIKEGGMSTVLHVLLTETASDRSDPEDRNEVAACELAHPTSSSGLPTTPRTPTLQPRSPEIPFQKTRAPWNAAEWIITSL